MRYEYIGLLAAVFNVACYAATSPTIAPKAAATKAVSEEPVPKTTPVTSACQLKINIDPTWRGCGFFVGVMDDRVPVFSKVLAPKNSSVAILDLCTLFPKDRPRLEKAAIVVLPNDNTRGFFVSGKTYTLSSAAKITFPSDFTSIPIANLCAPEDVPNEKICM